MDDGTAYVTIEGLAPDVAGLSKLFPDIDSADIVVEPPEGVVIEKEATGDGFTVSTHEIVRSRAHGTGVREALKASTGRYKADGLARVANQLNAAGLVCDPEYRPIAATSWGIEKAGGSSYGIPSDPDASYRRPTSHGRVPQHLDMAETAARVVAGNETAERVLYLLGSNPGWVGLNIILEAIAWHEKTSVTNLHTLHLAPEGFVAKFKNAANTARDQGEDPRHFAKPDGKPNKSGKVSLWGARVTVREIVHYWILEHLAA